MLISIDRTEQRRYDKALSVGVSIGRGRLADSEHIEVTKLLSVGILFDS
jgi:hypothetical protein